MTGTIGTVQPVVESYTTGSAAGRWPANLILTHSPDCQQTGTADVPATKGVPQAELLNGISGAGRSHSRNGDQWTPTFGNGDGTETVATWNCAPGCPVAALNTQSGDTSNPSRFFTTTEWDPQVDVPFLYVAKPSRRERNAGLDGMPEHVTNTDTPPGTPGSGSPRPGANRNGAAANFHPTVKPVALMRHLVRLVTRPGGTVLDPFLGSGTTAVAATLEGFDWIGCELTDDYLPIIQARVAWAEQHQPEPDLTLFNDAQ